MQTTAAGGNDGALRLAALACALALLAGGCAAPGGRSAARVPVEERGQPVRAVDMPRAPASGPVQESAPEPGRAPAPQAPAEPAVVSPAVVALLNQANSQSRAGELEQAAASLERALRIEPANAWLWHRLAMIRLFQHQEQEALDLAGKSNVLAVGNRRLQADNWRIIAQARERLGQTREAAQAADQVRRLSDGPAP